MKENRTASSILLEVLKNSVLTIPFLYFLRPELLLLPLTASKLGEISFILFCVNLPTMIKLYIGKETSKVDEKENVSFKQLPLEEKIKVAKEVKGLVTVKITLKMWLFIFGFTSFCAWYFLRNKQTLTGESIFLSVFLGVFFSLSLVGLYLIIEDEKNKK